MEDGATYGLTNLQSPLVQATEPRCPCQDTHSRSVCSYHTSKARFTHSPGASHEKEKEEQVIELDAPPRGPRPDELLPLALEGTGLHEVQASAKTFGCWLFDYESTPADEWKAAYAKIAENIKILHREGYIRYGAIWGGE